MSTTSHPHHHSWLHPEASDPAANDPFVGTQERTDSHEEADHTPPAEVVYNEPPHGQPTKSRRIAAVLGILLGAFGAHRFYLHYWTLAWFQLGLFVGGFALVTFVAVALGSPFIHAALTGLFFVIVIPMWGAVEGLLILTRSVNQDAEGHPLLA